MQHTAMTKEQTVKGEDSSTDVTNCDDDVLYVMTKEMTPKDSHRDATHCDDEGKGKEQTVKGQDSSIDVAYCGDDVLNV